MANKDIPHCFVADLAKEARTVIDAYNWADKMIVRGGKGDERKDALRRQMDWLHEKKGAIEAGASAFPANSAIGAMFQLHLINDLSGLIEGLIPEKSERARDCKEWRDAIDRMCCSVRNYIAATSGADPVDACADYYMSKELDPHHVIALAVARQEVKDDEA